MSPEPEKHAAAPGSETAPAGEPASAPFSSGQPPRKGPPASGPGEPYTPLPDFSRPARPRWLYALAAFLLALAAAAGIFFSRERPATPAARQPAPVEAPAVPGPQAGN